MTKYKVTYTNGEGEPIRGFGPATWSGTYPLTVRLPVELSIESPWPDGNLHWADTLVLTVTPVEAVRR